MDMDNFQDDIKIIANKGKKKSYEVDYDDLTQAMVEDLIKADVDHISSIFGVDVRASVHWRLHWPSLPTHRTTPRRCFCATSTGTRTG